MSNLQTYYHFKQDFKKVNQHDVIVDGLATLGPHIRYAIFNLLCVLEMKNHTLIFFVRITFKHLFKKSIF